MCFLESVSPSSFAQRLAQCLCYTHTINFDKILYFHLIFFFNPKQDQFLKLKKKKYCMLI